MERFRVSTLFSAEFLLGPLLFLLYINDIVDELETALFLFADDSKLFQHIKTKADIATLQRDLVRLEQWSERWLLRFHPGKCHVLSLGSFEALSKLSLRHGEYTLCGQTLDHVDEERDLGVIVDDELTFEKHIDAKISKANSFLGLIRRNFSYLDKDMLLTLYKAFVRPHLEYAQSVWAPTRQGLINKIENVQMRALNLVPEFKGLSYEEQLRRSNLPTLAYRRFRGDLIEVYKHFTTYDSNVLSKSFKINVRKPDKLVQGHSLTPLYSRLFYHRIQELWNNLPDNCRNLENSLNAFKNNFDNHWRRVNLPLLYDHRARLPTRINTFEPPLNSLQRHRVG